MTGFVVHGHIVSCGTTFNCFLDKGYILGVCEHLFASNSMFWRANLGGGGGGGIDGRGFAILTVSCSSLPALLEIFQLSLSKLVNEELCCKGVGYQECSEAWRSRAPD